MPPRALRTIEKRGEIVEVSWAITRMHSQAAMRYVDSSVG